MGKVHAGGYLRNMILEKNAIAPESWDNAKRKKSITSAIHKIVREKGAFRGAIGHKLVISVSNEVQEKVDRTELNLDYLLAKEMKKVMGEFQRKFYPKERIAYAWGIHHDTDNRHIHIFLSNRTASGKHVAMSCPLKRKNTRGYIQKDQIGYINSRMVLAENRILREVKNCIDNQLEVNSESNFISLDHLKDLPESFSQ